MRRCSFGHLPAEVIVKVVDKFIMQLEAQLADRNVSIELTDEARKWLVENGYDEQMGARPMARVIQSGDQDAAGRRGAVRPAEERAARCVFMVTTDDDGTKKLGFVYPEGPVLPRPERDNRRGRQEARSLRTGGCAAPRRARQG